MANLRINGSPINNDDRTLFGEFINQLTRDLANRSQVISLIRVNGEVLDESYENTLSMQSLGQLTSIDITTSNQLDLAFEALNTAKQYIRKLTVLSRATGDLYQKNKDRITAEKSFLDLVEGLDNLTNLLVSAQAVLRGKFKGVHTNDSSLRIAQVRLVSAIEELLPAKRGSDYIMLADILVNELPAALSEMADYGIPVLQRLKTS
jgi:hypothetical protein